MYVTTSSADLHVQMVDIFGLPQITDPDNIEIFGPYHLGDGPKFWTYNPKTKVWSVECARDDDDIDIAISWLPSIEDVPELTSSLDVVRTMARPSLPDDENIRHDGAKFIFEYTIFQWIFFPELRRWEAAPIAVI